MTGFLRKPVTLYRIPQIRKCDIMIFMKSENNKPAVTVISVCRNPGRDIIRTLESVLAQDYAKYEYLIEDGGSDDGTDSVVEKFREKFEERGIPLTFISEPDGGIYDAMNRAAGRASGEWVIFMNAGDCFYSKSVLSAVFDGRDLSDSGILFGDAVEYEYGRFYMFRKAFDKIEERMPFSHQSAFVRRELMMSRPFDTGYRIGADYDFLLDMYRKGVVFTDTGVITCIVSKDGVSSIKLYDTYMETLKIRAAYGIGMPSGEDLAKKRREMVIKQFVMDHFPDFIKKMIRRFQLKVRGQNADLTIPDWALLS